MNEAVVREWLRRVEEEYRSAAITQHLTLWLLQLGLSPDLVRAGLAIGETVAVPLFRALREGCRVPVARVALDRVLRDEVRHRDFGWALLDALLASPAAELTRAVASRVLADAFGELRAGYGGDAWSPGDEERAWGLMSHAEYEGIVEMTFEQVWRSRFAERDIDAAAAWVTAAPAAPLVRG